MSGGCPACTAAIIFAWASWFSTTWTSMVTFGWVSMYFLASSLSQSPGFCVSASKPGTFVYVSLLHRVNVTGPAAAVAGATLAGAAVPPAEAGAAEGAGDAPLEQAWSTRARTSETLPNRRSE